MRKLIVLAPGVLSAAVFAQLSAQQPAPAPPPLPPLVAVKPIDPPATPLPGEAESAAVTRFSFIAYGDTRSGSSPEQPGDGQIIHPQHNALADLMLAKAKEYASTPFPIRFVVQSGDAVLRGVNGTMWNVSFTPIIEKLTRGGNLAFFFSAGNHDVTGMPMGDRGRSQGLYNTLTAMSKLIPPEGSPRRLSGYPTYGVGFGNLFLLAIDSNIALDPFQLTWVTAQLEHLDRSRFVHVIAAFHHPTFSSGPHGGDTLEPASAAIRDLYLPLFRKHHVRMTITGHDHLLDHWIERYDDGGVTYRRDDIVTGGGGAPIYAYDSEPDLTGYLAATATQKVRVEHLIKPGPTPADNPHHFVVIRVDGDRLSLEVVGLGDKPFQPYGKPRIDLNDSGS